MKLSDINPDAIAAWRAIENMEDAFYAMQKNIPVIDKNQREESKRQFQKIINHLSQEASALPLMGEKGQLNYLDLFDIAGPLGLYISYILSLPGKYSDNGPLLQVNHRSDQLSFVLPLPDSDEERSRLLNVIKDILPDPVKNMQDDGKMAYIWDVT